MSTRRFIPSSSAGPGLRPRAPSWVAALHDARVAQGVATVGLACFAYVLLRPVSHNFVLVPVLALMGLCGVAGWVVYGRRMHHHIAAPAGLLMAVTVFGSLIGLRNPGVLESAILMVAFPTMFWVCASAVDGFTLRWLLAIAAWASIITSVSILLLVGGELHTLPQLLPGWMRVQMGGAVDSTPTLAVRWYALSTLVAAGPLWTASLFLKRDRFLPHYWVRLAATITSVAAALVSGRNALLLAIALAPLLVWLSGLIVTRGHSRSPVNRWMFAGYLALLVAGVKYATLAPRGSSLRNAWDSVTTLVTLNSAESSVSGLIRLERLHQLDPVIRAHPIFGTGIGANIPGYPRNPIHMEMQYHVLLSQTGNVGGTLALAGLVATVLALRAAHQRAPEFGNTIIVTAAAAVSMLISNATNPYLIAPGHLWVVFLPFAVANYALQSTEPAPRPSARAPTWLPSRGS